MSMHGHERWASSDYIRMAFRMGLSGALRLGYRFGSAIMAMFQVWRDHLSERAKELRAEHDRTMQTIAERVRVGSDKLRALQMLWARPVTGRLGRSCARVSRPAGRDRRLDVADRRAAVDSSVLPLTYVTPIAVALGAGIYAWMKIVARDRPVWRAAPRRQARLRAAADALRHHGPHAQAADGAISEGVTYVNLGGWAVDDLDAEQVEPAPCTHLVIRHIEGRPHAELRRWCTELGPSILKPRSRRCNPGCICSR